MPITPAIAIVAADVRDVHGRVLGDAALGGFAADLSAWAGASTGRSAGSSAGPSTGSSARHSARQSARPDASRMSDARFAVREGSLVATLGADADPLRPLLANGLAPQPSMVRWSIAAGPAGEALLKRALDALDLARTRRDGLVVRTPEPGADRLLDAIAPLLPELLAEMTERQRELGRILLLDGGRQADAAEALGVSRATVSVMTARGRIRSIERLADAVRTLVLAALAAREETGAPNAATAPAVPARRR